MAAARHGALRLRSVTGFSDNGWQSRPGAELTIASFLIRTHVPIKVACSLDPLPSVRQTPLGFAPVQSLTAMEVPVTPEANPATIVETLTPREVEVLQAITLGMNNPDIAAEFDLSLDTVKTHVKSILQKLRARNRTHAVVCALIAGIVLLPAAAPIAIKIKATKAGASQQDYALKDLGSL
jgi:DNA-binding CsgD family transcriptional regulator